MNQLTLFLVFLGIVQGISEFLPISSSGHLVIIQQIPVIKSTLDNLGENINVFLGVALHMASLIAIIIFLRKDIIQLISGFFTSLFNKDFGSPDFKISISIVIASIPAAFFGFVFEDFFKMIFSSALSAFILLIINGIILILTKKIPKKDRNIEEIGFVRSFIIGIFQAIAIMPGISRAGMTIAGGMFNGLKPVESARFSFLMAIPVIMGAGLLEGIKAFQGTFPEALLIPLLIAMCVTVIVALFSLKVLFILVKKIRLDIFGYYTIAIGIIGITLVLLF